MCIKAKFSKVKSPYAEGYSPGVTTESYTESPCLKRDWKLQWEVGIYEQLYNDKTTFFFGDFGTNYKMYGIWQQARFHKLVLMLKIQQIQTEMFALWADQWLPAHSSIQILPFFLALFCNGTQWEKKEKRKQWIRSSRPFFGKPNLQAQNIIKSRRNQQLPIKI